MFERLRRWAALSEYKHKLPVLLVRRYGRRQAYTPPQILTTIKVHRLNVRYAAYACAMFCSKQAYAAFLAKEGSNVESGTFAPLHASVVPVSFGFDIATWPAYEDLVANVPHSVPDSHGWDSATHHSGDMMHRDGDWGTHHEAYSHGGFDGGGSHHGGGHDGGMGGSHH